MFLIIKFYGLPTVVERNFACGNRTINLFVCLFLLSFSKNILYF